MKKINLLKAIVDVVWIFSLFIIPIFMVLVLFVIFRNESFDIPLRINGNRLMVVDFSSKIMLFGFMIVSLLILYGLYLFKKLLRLFQLKIIFDSQVVQLLSQIGYVIIICAILSGISNFLFNFFNNELSLSLELNANVLLFSLGLFFLILSEVFKIAKGLKEENDLTF